VVPGPGSYLQSDSYFYDGSAGGSIQLPIGGILAANIDALAVLELPTMLHVTSTQVLGGLLGFTLTMPFGWQEISAGATLTGPLGATIGVNVTEDDFQIGDPVLGAMIGWHSGNWHWNLSGAVNVPVGEWEQGRLVNLGFNRWIVDVTGAATWLDMAQGYEISGALGFTFNGDNLELDYRTGTEMHLEASATKLFANGFSIGLAGYHYEQLTGDSGDDARLGAFEGRVTGIGPTIGATIPLHDRAIMTKLRWYHEFNVENRLTGDSVWLTAAIPLQPDPPHPAK
jgi:hypothetical protein